MPSGSRIEADTRKSASLVMCTRYSGCRAPFVMMFLFYDNGSTTTCPTSTRSCSKSFNMEILTFVGHLGILVHLSEPPHVPPRRVPPMALVPRCLQPFHSHGYYP
eukprot:scaffold10944_cov110-Isochrysis_galbana.AAC.3